MNKEIILSTAYFPTIQYISKFLFPNKIIIEKHENYLKQSYRNRCNISTANGIQSLVIPIKKLSGKRKITEIEIDYSTNWQKNHLRTIDAAYKSSPFYEYYIDAFIKIFNDKHLKLFIFNSELLKTILSEIIINKEFSYSNEYVSFYVNDYRMSINPKEKHWVKDTKFNQIEYTQVFTEKFGYISDLSIIDILFNKGPETELYLKECIKT